MTTRETAHSPTNWDIGKQDEMRIAIYDNNKELVALIPGLDRRPGKENLGINNAKHIVKCVNSHQGLIDALKACHDILANNRVNSNWSFAVNKAEAVLKSAGEL